MFRISVFLYEEDSCDLIFLGVRHSGVNWQILSIIEQTRHGWLLSPFVIFGYLSFQINRIYVLQN